MSATPAGAPQPQDKSVPGPKHNQEQPVVWERWQKKRTFVRALEGTYSHLTKELLEQPRVISSRSVPWKGGPNLYGKHVIAPGAAAKITQSIESHIEAYAPGAYSQKHGHLNSACFYIIKGRGHDIHDGRRIEWKAGDVMFVENGCKADNTDITGAESLQNNKKLCSVSGSTPAQRIKDKYPGVQLQQYDTYSACVEALKNGAVDAVTTDEVILAGYAAQTPGAFKIVGKPFSEERYGIGLKKGDTELCNKVTDAVKKMESDGAWKAAWDKNLGPAGLTAPAPPALDPC